MENPYNRIEALQTQIAALERQLQELKSQLASAQDAAKEADGDGVSNVQYSRDDPLLAGSEGWDWPLAPDEYVRYGRQMIVPGIGLDGTKEAASRFP